MSYTLFATIVARGRRQSPRPAVVVAWTSRIVAWLWLNSELSMMRTFLRALFVSGAIAFWIMAVLRDNVNLR